MRALDPQMESTLQQLRDNTDLIALHEQTQRLSDELAKLPNAHLNRTEDVFQPLNLPQASEKGEGLCFGNIIF